MKRFRNRWLVTVLTCLMAFAFTVDAVADLTVTMKTKWESLDRAGNTFIWTISDILWDSSYPTGGESVTAADFGVTYRIKAIWKIYDTYKCTYNYDEPNQKFMMLYGDNNNANDGPMVEVPNTEDLSAVTTRVMTMGW